MLFLFKLFHFKASAPLPSPSICSDFAQCVHVREPLFVDVWQRVCLCRVSLRTLETPKTFQRPRVLLFKGLHYLPLSLCFHHMMFFIFQPFLICSLLGSLCPFPSVSRPSTTDPTTVASVSHRLELQAHHGSDRTQ